MTTKSEGMMIPGKLKWYVILALALWLAFSGVAAAEQMYVNESGWWQEGGAFNASTAPIQAAVDATGEGDAMDDDYVIPEAIPPVEIYRGSNTTFNVSVTNHGNQYYDVNLIFRDLPDGIAMSDAGGTKLINIGETVWWRITIHASECASVGAYTIEIADNAANDPHTWCPVLLSILLPASTAAEQLYVNETGWWRDGGTFNESGTPIQAAVDAAGAGDSIFVWNGSYSENVNVDKPRLTLEGEGADVVTVTAASADDHVFEVRNCVNISGFAVRGATDSGVAGIYLDNVNHCNISGNDVCGSRYGIYMKYSSSNALSDNTASSNNVYGVYLRYSNYNTLSSNTVNLNNVYGIYLERSSSNTLSGNTANLNNDHGIHISSSSDNALSSNTANLNNDYGVYMEYSSNNTLQNNTISGSSYNFGVWGSDLSHYIQDIDTNNTVDGRSIHYLVNQTNRQIPSDAGFVGVVNSTNITIRDMTLTKNGEGVLLAYTENSRIENVTTSNNWYGIHLTHSSSNTLQNNTVNSNKYHGIYLLSSNWNTLQSNTANLNDAGPGVHLSSSSNNMLLNNTANSNNWYHGISLSYSNSNTLQSNTASNNYCGICVSSSNSNMLGSNNCSNNRDDGIWMSSSSGNTLQGNTANLNNDYGIRMSSSNCNVLQSNIISNNRDGGIWMFSSNCNTLSDNNASCNNNGGVYLSSSNSNTLQGNTANSNDDGIYLSSSNGNSITCNWVQNNERGFYLSNSISNNISYNNIIKNGADAFPTPIFTPKSEVTPTPPPTPTPTPTPTPMQFYNDQPYTVEAQHNYWGAGMNNSTIDASIYDDEEGGWGEVEFYPFETEPVPCAPTPEELPAFTTADAVIALQIAAGSRPPDLCWDVSGDNRVTSLDALMILQAVMQAAAGR